METSNKVSVGEPSEGSLLVSIVPSCHGMNTYEPTKKNRNAIATFGHGCVNRWNQFIRELTLRPVAPLGH